MLDLNPPGPLHLQEEGNLPEGFLLLSGSAGREQPWVRKRPAPSQRQPVNTFPPGHQQILPRSILPRQPPAEVTCAWVLPASATPRSSTVKSCLDEV